MEDKIIEVMSAVFGIPISEIDSESSPNTIESWDSLSHMNLVIALEEEFDIQFTDEEIVRLLSQKEILSILSEKV